MVCVYTNACIRAYKVFTIHYFRQIERLSEVGLYEHFCMYACTHCRGCADCHSAGEGGVYVEMHADIHISSFSGRFTTISGPELFCKLPARRTLCR